MTVIDPRPSGRPSKPDTKRLELRVANLDCDSDANRIERGLSGVQGVTELKVFAKSARVDLQ